MTEIRSGDRVVLRENLATVVGVAKDGSVVLEKGDFYALCVEKMADLVVVKELS